MWSKPGLVKTVPTDIFALEATEMMGSEALLGAVCVLPLDFLPKRWHSRRLDGPV